MKPSEIKHKTDTRMKTKNLSKEFLEQRVKELEDDIALIKSERDLKFEGDAYRIKELEVENTRLLNEGIDLQDRIKTLESANAENMIAYGEEMLKKDKEIEILLNQNVAFPRLLGEFIGTLKGVIHWDIPEELREKLKNQILELESNIPNLNNK